MKNVILTMGYLFALSAFANIDYSPEDEVQPSAEEVAQSRACFEELSQESCGDPGEDAHHFRTCLKERKATLSPECQKMMTGLYGR